MDGRPTEVLRGSRTALVTTFRRDGRPVATPVSIAVDGDRAYFVTAVDSGKARRLARCDRVTVAPCTVGGDRLGPVVSGSARLLQPGRSWRSRVLRPTGSLFWSWLLYRLQGRPMALYEVALDGAPTASPASRRDSHLAVNSRRVSRRISRSRHRSRGRRPCRG